MKLPEQFTERMHRILGEEYGAFEKSYEETRKYGLRVNTGKISPEEFERIAPFHLTPIPWIPGGYYYPEEDAPARHPFYYAGLYYLQEPSAMTPASVLDIEKGNKVLDLCAAPGGKATALGAKLNGTGLLTANDISASRAKALLKNLEVFGIPNLFVTNAVPARLAEQFPEYFDRILVDAPCSGEGMFRKDADTIRAWSPDKPEACVKIQREIVMRAVDMLCPGGKMLYSTCTFSPLENEEMIRYILRERPEMELLPIAERTGFSEGLICVTEENGCTCWKTKQSRKETDIPVEDGDLSGCVRLWPHIMSGEGHFMALLRKRQNMSDGGNAEDTGTVNGCANEQRDSRSSETRIYQPEGFSGTGRRKKAKRKGGAVRSEALDRSVSEGKQREIVEAFMRLFPLSDPDMGTSVRMEIRGPQVYLTAAVLPSVTGIPFLRNGLYLGEIKKDRFEPSQSYAMALKAGQIRDVISLDQADNRLMRYLRGETIEIAEEESETASGWKLICVNGYPLGWGKLVNGLLKNKYHNGWRMS